jgi:hypothetical protein
MDESLRDRLRPGARVKVTQQIAGRDYAWTTETAGTVVSYRQRPTGSWFAHSRDRLELRLDDGELTTLNLDEFSRVDIEKDAPVETGASAAAKSDESDLPV